MFNRQLLLFRCSWKLTGKSSHHRTLDFLNSIYELWHNRELRTLNLIHHSHQAFPKGQRKMQHLPSTGVFFKASSTSVSLTEMPRHSTTDPSSPTSTLSSLSLPKALIAQWSAARAENTHSNAENGMTQPNQRLKRISVGSRPLMKTFSPHNRIPYPQFESMGLTCLKCFMSPKIYFKIAFKLDCALHF